MKLGLLILFILLAAYGLLAAYAWRFSDGRLFFPEYGSGLKPEGWLEIDLADGTRGAALYLPNEQARYTLWYFHGNGEDLGDLGPRLRALHQRGYAVFAVEYPGYGLNGGQPSEKGIYDMTQAGLNYLRDVRQVPLRNVIAYGRSLGGGPAVELASRELIGGLILESAFTSAFRVVTGVKLLPFDKFDNLARIRRVECPVLVMHGTQDRVVPFSHGKTLWAAVPGRQQYLWIPDAGHNNLLDRAGSAYWEALETFSNQLD